MGKINLGKVVGNKWYTGTEFPTKVLDGDMFLSKSDNIIYQFKDKVWVPIINVNLNDVYIEETVNLEVEKRVSLIKEEIIDPKTLSGKWFFTNPKNGTLVFNDFDIDFKDSLGNNYKKILFYNSENLKTIHGIDENDHQIALYVNDNGTYSGLSVDSNGELIQNYYLTFLKEQSSVLKEMKIIAKKFNFKPNVLGQLIATEDYVNNLLANFSSLDLRPVNVLPTENISTTSIYLLKTDNVEETNVYEEYIYVNDKWELIGTTKVDLSNYLPLSAGPGKRLTGNLFLDVDKKIYSYTSENHQRSLIGLVNDSDVLIGTPSATNYYGKIAFGSDIIPGYQDANYSVNIGTEEQNFGNVYCKNIYSKNKPVATEEYVDDKFNNNINFVGELSITPDDKNISKLKIGDETITTNSTLMSRLELSSRNITTPVIEINDINKQLTPAYGVKVDLGSSPTYGRAWNNIYGTNIYGTNIYQKGSLLATQEDVENIKNNLGETFLLQEYNGEYSNCKVKINPGFVENDISGSIYADTSFLKLQTENVGYTNSIILGRDEETTILSDSPLIRIKAGDNCYYTMDGTSHEIGYNEYTNFKLKPGAINLTSSDVINLTANDAILNMTSDGIYLQKLYSISAPISKGSTIFSKGALGQVLTTDGTNVYWSTPEASSVNLDNYYTKKDVDTLLSEIGGGTGGFSGEEFITVESQETSFELLPNKYYNFGVRTNELTLTLNSIQDNIVYEFMGQITIDEPNECRVTFNNEIRWRLDDNIIQEGNTLILNPKFIYSFSVLNGLGVIMSFANKELDIPTLEINGTILSWNYIENADQYAVYNNNVLMCSTTDLFIDLSNYISSTTSSLNTLYVVAQSDIYTDTKSNEVTYNITEKLATPTNLILSDAGVLSWDAVENAYSYSINLVNSAGAITFKSSTNNYIDLATDTEITADTYTITVQAMPDYTSLLYTSSDKSEPITYIKEA